MLQVQKRLQRLLEGEIMNNYENQKKAIDLILQKNCAIAVDKDTKEVVNCRELNCENCLFSYRYNEHHYCNVNRIKWLLSEYVEPEVDWSKIPIDTPVLASEDGVNWHRRYFAGVIDGKPLVYSNGGTSWSIGKDGEIGFRYIKLAEVE